jgi:hypothetical protein
MPVQFGAFSATTDSNGVRESTALRKVHEKTSQIPRNFLWVIPASTTIFTKTDPLAE